MDSSSKKFFFQLLSSIIFLIILFIILFYYINLYKNNRQNQESFNNYPSTTSPLVILDNEKLKTIKDIKSMNLAIVEKLKGISSNYFVEGVSPSLEISNRIENLKNRLNKVNLDLAEINGLTNDNEEIIFY